MPNESNEAWLRRVTAEATERRLVLVVVSRDKLHFGNGARTEVDCEGIMFDDNELRLALRLTGEQRNSLAEVGVVNLPEIEAAFGPVFEVCEGKP